MLSHTHLLGKELLVDRLLERAQPLTFDQNKMLVQSSNGKVSFDITKLADSTTLYDIASRHQLAYKLLDKANVTDTATSLFRTGLYESFPGPTGHIKNGVMYFQWEQPPLARLLLLPNELDLSQVPNYTYPKLLAVDLIRTGVWIEEHRNICYYVRLPKYLYSVRYDGPNLVCNCQTYDRLGQCSHTALISCLQTTRTLFKEHSLLTLC